MTTVTLLCLGCIGILQFVDFLRCLLGGEDWKLPLFGSACSLTVVTVLLLFGKA